ncbi:hypothetical protein VNO78_02759 [Psophocarpus tetragonolobus]|uniref:Uncharacterized protein n=1 Tax=Psophocarpus tetragonolobus TaxID=3891 RepID=A0AAN9TBA5_PSOTE
MDVANDLHMGVSTRSQKQKRERKRKNQGDAEGPDFSLDNSSPKTDATIKHPLHESPALPNFLSCQIIVEYSTKNDQSKRKKTKHNDNEGNATGCDTPENTFSPNASTPALNMPSEHPIQCFSSDPITNQSGVDVGFCEGHNEENEQNMIDPTAENSIAHYGVPEVSCNHISVATSPEPFAKDYVSEDIKLNTEHGINDNIFILRIKWFSLVKKIVDNFRRS